MTRTLIKIFKVLAVKLQEMGEKAYLQEKKFALRRIKDLISINQMLSKRINVNEEEMVSLESEYLTESDK